MTKILVCDDDQGISEVIRIMLESEGHQVLTLPNGKGIIRRIQEYQPDIFFVDIWMPGIDGKEIIKLLRSDPQTATLPIIIISALDNIAEISKSCGATDYLPKPFEMDHLFGLVKKYS